nr:unnamed protein product [Callosobruchus chinensis]
MNRRFSPPDHRRGKRPSSTSIDDREDRLRSPPLFERRPNQMFRGNRDRRDTERSHDSDSNMSGTNQDVIPLQNGPGIGPPNVWSNPPSGIMGGGMGLGYPMVGMNMIVDPNMMSINNYGMIPPILPPDPNLIGPDPSMMMNPIKEIIHCKSCTLFPPNPNAPMPSTRDRPPGCRTVFVGGLPENMTEDIIREIFDRCGEITTLRLSKKNFCHIRFVYEASVDAAIFLSGYRVRIGSNTEPANTGRLHVDFAQARDDQYEWECRQRQLQREQRHRERMEEERMRPPSPPPVVHYTDHEAAAVAEKIKQDETFTKAVQVVITWLDRGDCNKRNVNIFYSMIQSTNSHIRRLLGEKSQYEDELRKAKELMKGRMQGILLQFSQIERLFVAACHKKVWDHFTKAQRKNIETWKKQSLEIKNVQLEDPGSQRDDDEMDVSDDEDFMRKRQRQEVSIEETNNLKDENDNLRCQLEAYKNEVEVLKVDYKKDMDDKDKQFKVLQQTLQGMQQQLLEAKKRQSEEEARVRDLQAKLSGERPPRKYDRRILSDKEIINLDDSENEQCDSVSVTECSSEGTASTTTQRLNECDAKLVGVISAFLNVHPFGAGLDYIWSYVSKIESNIRPSDIESLMNRFPSVFKQELVGIGANIERKWIFHAFSSAVNGKS